MKKVVSILLAILCLTLTGCGHTHVWQASTCISPKICPECGETEGEPLGHTWVAATCEESRYCSLCGQTSGEALGHKWNDATCILPATCEVCSETDGNALGHSMLPATCTMQSTCSVCGVVEGEPLERTAESWEISVDSTCTDVGIETSICTVCGNPCEQEIPLKEHTPSEWKTLIQPEPGKKGTRAKNCTVCDFELEKEEFSLSDKELEDLYKKNCQWISYDSLSRNPDKYEGEYVKFSGYVVQVCSESSNSYIYSTYRVATYGRYDNVVFLKANTADRESRILEDDYITFYGKYDGLYSYKTVLGAKITIPCIVAEYID